MSGLVAVPIHSGKRVDHIAVGEAAGLVAIISNRYLIERGVIEAEQNLADGVGLRASRRRSPVDAPIHFFDALRAAGEQLRIGHGESGLLRDISGGHSDAEIPISGEIGGGQDGGDRYSREKKDLTTGRIRI